MHNHKVTLWGKRSLKNTLLIEMNAHLINRIFRIVSYTNEIETEMSVWCINDLVFVSVDWPRER